MKSSPNRSNRLEKMLREKGWEECGIALWVNHAFPDIVIDGNAEIIAIYREPSFDPMDEKEENEFLASAGLEFPEYPG